METQFFTRPEGTLAYSDYGGYGALVLMLPGMGALRSEYRTLAPKLREAGYRAVSVDLRGLGESSVPWEHYDVPSIGNDILALIDYLDAGSAHLICTSKACGAGVWAAAEHPDHFRSLTLIGAFARDVKINPVMGVLFWLMMHNPWRVRAWISYYRTIYPSRKPDDFDSYLKQLEENLKQPGRFDASNAIGTASLKPSEERLKQITVPSMILMGSKDPDFPDPRAEGKYLELRMRAALHMIDGAGHYPQTEMPEITLPLILDFLKRSEADVSEGAKPIPELHGENR